MATLGTFKPLNLGSGEDLLPSATASGNSFPDLHYLGTIVWLFPA